MNDGLPIITPHPPENGKKRVAAYCRVSSLSEEQLHSYNAQVDYYRAQFAEDDSVIFVGVYGDAGISGTRTANREGFLRMMKDCRKGLIDCIWTKSVSRFGRNTVDTLVYTRELRSLGIEVFFEKENISTKDASGEMMLTLMAAFAESESEGMSQNIIWSKRHRFEQGLVSAVNISGMNGFRQENGVVTVVEEEAAIIRRIYREYLDGYNLQEIGEHLNIEGIPTKGGGLEWTGTQIRNILTNEKYIGDCLLQKKFNPDPITHRNVRNRGELPQYYVEGCYPVIIEKETWQVIQELLRRRGNRKARDREGYPFSGLMRCAVCGKAFNQAITTGPGRVKFYMYRCISWKDHSGVAVEGMTYTRPHTIRFVSNPTPELAAYREKYSSKPTPRPYLCSDTRVPIDRPAKGFVQAWNILVSRKQRYLPGLQENENSEDVVVRYYSERLCRLLGDAVRLEEFDVRLFRQTVEGIDVNPGGKLTYLFKAGIRITV